MGGKFLTNVLKSFLNTDYPGFEKDLFSAFISRNLFFAKTSGQLGFMSPFVWMFISSYENLRSHLIDNTLQNSLIQLEYSGFDGATVPICTFTLSKKHIPGFVGTYIVCQISRAQNSRVHERWRLFEIIAVVGFIQQRLITLRRFQVARLLIGLVKLYCIALWITP